MKDIVATCFPVQTPYFENFWFTSYWPNYFHPIRLQDSLIMNTSGSNGSIYLIFLHWDIHQEKVACETTTLVGCAGFDQNDLKWTITYASQQSTYAQFCQWIACIQFWDFTSTCHPKRSNNSRSLLCFVRNQENGKVKNWYRQSRQVSFPLWVLYKNSIAKTPETTT